MNPQPLAQSEPESRKQAMTANASASPPCDPADSKTANSEKGNNAVPISNDRVPFSQRNWRIASSRLIGAGTASRVAAKGNAGGSSLQPQALQNLVVCSERTPHCGQYMGVSFAIIL